MTDPTQGAAKLYIVTFGNVVWVFNDETLAELSYTAAVGTNQNVTRFRMTEDEWQFIREALPPQITVMDYTAGSKPVTHDGDCPNATTQKTSRVEATRAAMEQTGRDLGERRDV